MNNVILSDFQQYRILLAKVIQFLSLLKNVKIKDTNFWLPTDEMKQCYLPKHEVVTLFCNFLIIFHLFLTQCLGSTSYDFFKITPWYFHESTFLLKNMYAGCNSFHGINISKLTLKVPTMTAADDNFCDIFPNIQKKKLWYFMRTVCQQTILIKYHALSYDVTSRSVITPCNKICKPLVVYRFSGNVMTSNTPLHT